MTNDRLAALHRLIHAEAEIRQCKSLEELGFLLVTELCRASGARQGYLIEVQRRRFRITRTSGSGSVDAHSPTVQWLQTEIAHHLGSSVDKPVPLTLRTGNTAPGEGGRHFPFPHARWFPFHISSKGKTTAVLVVNDKLFEEGAVTISRRFIETAAHAAKVLSYRPPRKSMGIRRNLLVGLCAVCVIAGLVFPVPMTALAPVEIVAKSPFVVAAPIDGVIQEIVVAPNALVKSGDVLIRYIDTLPRNSFQIAERELAVADSKLRQLSQLALLDDKAKRELAQARSEVALKQAERDLHKDTFEKSVIRAPQDGVAIYTDRKEWVGKPVSTGQRILEIADTAKVEALAYLPVGDILELEPGARTRIFLDGNPMRPLEAKIVSASHQAKLVEGIGLSYRVQAELIPNGQLPRLGVRGTAQLFGHDAPFAYYLFRRPMAWLRQKIGL